MISDILTFFIFTFSLHRLLSVCKIKRATDIKDYWIFQVNCRLRVLNIFLIFYYAFFRVLEI